MESLEKELELLLEKYQDKYKSVYSSKIGIVSHAENIDEFNKLFEPFVGEVVLKSNKFIDFYERDYIITKSQETIKKFKPF